MSSETQLGSFVFIYLNLALIYMLMNGRVGYVSPFIVTKHI
jgi:hypothetical protein